MQLWIWLYEYVCLRRHRWSSVHAIATLIMRVTSLNYVAMYTISKVNVLFHGGHNMIFSDISLNKQYDSLFI